MAGRPWVVLQHVPYEGPGLIATAAADAGLDVTVRRLFDGDGVPDPQDLDGIGALVVMGGPMGAAEDAEYPYLAAERTLLAAAVAAGLPVLGVCLGAQLLAAACGSPVSAGAVGPEIGLGIVELTTDGRRDSVFGPAGRVLPVLHWHGDTYEPPRDAVHLATSARYPQQAFRIGARAYGLQFHVEVDEDMATAMEPYLPDDLRLDRRHLALVQRVGRGLLARFVAVATQDT